MLLNFSVVPFSKTSGPPTTAGGSDTSLDKLKFVLQIVCAESELPEQLGVHLRRRAGQVDGSRHGVRHLGCYSSASVSGTTEALSRSVFAASRAQCGGLCSGYRQLAALA